MSGPCPVLAATEALGWMSSKDSLVTLTLTPVALVKAATIFMNCVVLASHEALPAQQR